MLIRKTFRRYPELKLMKLLTNTILYYIIARIIAINLYNIILIL